MEETTVSPGAAPAAEVSAEAAALAALTEKNRAIDQAEEDPAKAAEDKPKPEKTPEQRAIERLERKLGRVVGQREEARAEREMLKQQIAHLQGGRDGAKNGAEQSDSDQLSLTRAELQAAVEARARELAPSIRGQEDETAKRREVVSTLVKAWGQEAFTERTNDLAEVLDGAKQLLVLETDSPAALIEYLTDDDNADQAEAISRMSLGRAGYELAKIAAKLEKAKAESKAQPSQVAKPLEAVKATGAVQTNKLRDLDGDAFDKRRREQIARRR